MQAQRQGVRDFARPAADAIRKLDPKALIISAGSPKIDKNPGKYFRDAFKAGAAKVFNAVGLHPYEPSADAIIEGPARRAKGARQARRQELVAGDHRVRLGERRPEGQGQDRLGVKAG